MAGRYKESQRPRWTSAASPRVFGKRGMEVDGAGKIGATNVFRCVGRGSGGGAGVGEKTGGVEEGFGGDAAARQAGATYSCATWH